MESYDNIIDLSGYSEDISTKDRKKYNNMSVTRRVLTREDYIQDWKQKVHSN